jgi:hypothetical protein
MMDLIVGSVRLSGAAKQTAAHLAVAYPDFAPQTGMTFAVGILESG